MTPRKLTSAAVATALAGGLGLGAALYQGTPTTDIDLNDGGVWVTNAALNLVGHLNVASKVLDGSVRTVTDSFDLAQRDVAVLVTDSGATTLSQLDPATVSFTEETDLPAGAEVVLGGDTAAIVADGGRAIWALPADSAGTVQVTSAEATLVFPDPAAVTVGHDGATYAATDTTLVTVPVGGGEPVQHTLPGRTPEPEPSTEATEDDESTDDEPTAEGTPTTDAAPAPAGATTSDLAITAVGSSAVVLDRSTGELMLPGDRIVTLPDAANAQLQQPSAASDVVAIATPDALVLQPLDGGAATTIPAANASDSTRSLGTGIPAAPVQVAGCTYAAWAGTGAYLRECPGEDNDRAQLIPEGSTVGPLTFRVNREVVVINGLSTGTVWLTDDELTKVDNWQDVTPPAEEDHEIDDTVESTTDLAMAERQEQNTPPVAEDDTLGVRPGRTTLLRVLENDSDPDGDVLLAQPTSTPSLGTLDVVLGGAALQLTVPDDARGATSFTYQADDGRGGSDSAEVTVEVHDWSRNEGPTQLRPTGVVVEQGGTVNLNVLTDWIDPDGDDIFLASATSTTADQVQFTADGKLSFQDVGTSAGLKTVLLTVSDGQLTTQGELLVDVRPAGPLPPVAVADHVSATVGESVTVAPLENDSDPNGDALRLGELTEVEGVTITPDFASGTVTLSAAQAGVYYVLYNVSDGPHSTAGVIRFDVTEPSAQDAAPIAVRDTALLPVGGDVYLDPLVNDIDPTGGVLVVSAVVVPPDAGLQVAVVDHHLLRISAAKSLEAPVAFTYTVANGSGTATGQVTVIPVPRPATLQPPIAEPDNAVVRVGDVVDIDVLSNDSHPNGDDLTLVKDLVTPPPSGLAFTSGDLVRFQAPDEPGTIRLVYAVSDSAGQVSSAEVVIEVRAMDAEFNSPPRPENVSARVLAGASTRVEIPLASLDPDGDSVALVGLATAPTKGRVTEVGRTYIVYEAAPNASGTDTFTYEVVDRLGATARATVRVGIAARGDSNQNPVAVDDVVYARPDRAVAIDVLANDFDSDGDPISLDAARLEVASGDLVPQIVDGMIELHTPPVAATIVLYYGIHDSRAGTATASVTLEVSEDAPLQPPVAVDDVVLTADLAEDATSVRVAVLENDGDPDGRVADLTISAGEGASVTGSDVVVPLADTAQIVPYTVTDIDGLTASAFIWVPPAARDAREVPRLTSTTASATVVSGEELVLPLADYITVAGDRTPRLTDRDSVTAVNSDGSGLVVDDTTVRFVSATGYSGPASISVRVTDGTGADDPNGLTALLTIPITVTPPPHVNTPPTLTSSSLTVSPGEAPITLDLRALTVDPDDGDLAEMAYALAGGVPAGFTASLSGSVLSVSAASSTAKGTTAQLTVTADDGEASASANVTVTVAASTRPLATVNDESVPNANQGQPSTVAVLANDVSPFPGEPLTLVGDGVVETGEGTVRAEGGSLVVTPAATFVGTMVVRYTVADATGDPDRRVDGRVNVTVRGVPETPSTPIAEAIASRTVQVTWNAPANNGAPITAYTLAWNGGQQTCAGTVCEVTGLVNGEAYSFTVVATNEVGDSAASPVSASATPDAVPSAPAAPTLTPGDRSLTVSWTPPANEGSALQGYQVQISPSPGASLVDVPAGTTSYTWTGLTNGQDYQIQVRAYNKLGPQTPSDFSATSVSHPYGAPIMAGAPTTERLNPVGAQAQLRVSWSAANNNGDPMTYTLEVLRGGSVVNSLPLGADVTSQVVNLDTSESDYTFRVVGTNRAGSTTSAVSSPRRAFVAPGAPTSPSATAGNNTVTVSYGAAAGNGASAADIGYQYRVNGGSWAAVPSDRVIRSGVGNNGSYTIELRAVTTSDGVTYAGPAASAGTVAPFGPPRTPTTSASTNGTAVRVNWGDPGRNGLDYQVQIQIDGGSWENVANSGSRDVGNGYQQNHSICARTVDSQGQTSSSSCSNGRSADPPITEWSVTPWVDSCPQDQFNTSRYHSAGPTCDLTWLWRGTPITVVCYVNAWSQSGDTVWYRLKNQTLYVSRATVNGSTSGMPGC